MQDGLRTIIMNMSSLRWVFQTLVVVVALGCAASTVRADSFETVEIVTKSGVHSFAVEMARTNEQRATGLMNRKSLPEGQGMLFDFTPEQEVSMWMKNTYVSLDMIFIRADGRIHRIAERTKTESTDIISSGGPVRAVLEVVAGTAQKYGIAVGDRVAHPLFKRR
jgi:uncharacterized membrane protein (UPF0127 family)